MADIFISFKTNDTARVQPVFDGFRSRGLTVFWSNDIPKGAPNYQAILKDEILKAPVVVVVWTNASVHSGPVIQECSQAERANKLFQVLLDDIEPIDMPMEVKFKSHKTILLGWAGDLRHPEWIKLVNAIDLRLGRRPGTIDRYRAQGRIKIAAKHVHRAPEGWFLPGAGKTEWFKDHDTGPEMVVAPAGTFMMGSPATSTRPGTQHKVTITKPFAVGRHAITRGQFAAFVSATGYKADAGAHVYDSLDTKELVFDGAGSWRNPGFNQDDSHPVVCVNWQDAKAYAAWLTDRSGHVYRLPTEAEWEYFCRAGTTTSFWWSDSISPDEAANYDCWHDPHDYQPATREVYSAGSSYWPDRYAEPAFEDYEGSEPRGFDGSESTLKVDSFEANPWGLFNVHGNVWEWCEDAWHDRYIGAPSDGAAWLLGGDASRRVVRGGSWYSKLDFLRSAYRAECLADDRFSDIGFRVARTL